MCIRDRSYTATSFLPVALMVGICAGSLLAARGTPESWRTLLVPAIMGIGVLLCLVPVVAAADPALRLPLLCGLYALAGTCGGLYLIPVSYTHLDVYKRQCGDIRRERGVPLVREWEQEDGLAGRSARNAGAGRL